MFLERVVIFLNSGGTLFHAHGPAQAIARSAKDKVVLGTSICGGSGSQMTP